MNQGEIRLPYELYESIVEKSLSPDLSFIIEKSTYKCVCQENDIKLSIEYLIKVNNDNLKPAPTTNQITSKIMIKLFNTKATLISNQIVFLKHGDKSIDGTTIGSCLIISDGYYNLYATGVGRYQIKAEVSVPYLTAKNTGMELYIPKSSNNSVTFKVPKFDTNIKIFNSFPDVSATNDYNNSHHGKENVNDSTVVFVKLPGSERQLKVNWTVQEEVKPINSNTTNQVLNVKPNIVVQQNILCSIGEGLLLFKSQFNYNIISGIVSTINIAINKSMNIINVDGDAIKKWEVVDNGDTRPEFSNQTKLLQIALDYGVEGNHKFNVTGEMTMKDTSGESVIYSMVCLGDEIARQRGYIGIEARTNVEISETDSENISVIDVQELPPQVHSLAGHPILLSYKFLDQFYYLGVRVKKNLDCAVLVSICEEAHFISTLSYSGKTLHQLILKIKNTKQQFLKINVPFKYDVWTTLMDGVPTKPSFNDPFLLIPILKPGNQDSQKSILVEIVLLETNPAPLRITNGSYEIIMPKIDLQLRAAFATIYLPQGLFCNKFTGNLKNVSYFSSTPPSSITVNAHDLTNNVNALVQRADKLERRSSINYSKKSFISNSSVESKVRKDNKKGLIPVHVDMPTTSTMLFFEQILLSGDKSLNIKFDYKFKKP